MGIMSRRVLPACGSLCICCPELRARSRQPVKRYKTLLSSIFPKSQAELPNDSKIKKLTEYACKNPLRIPKIAQGIEQRAYKALRNERFSVVRVVMRAYSKLLSDCRNQMPLFAASALTMIRVLLELGRNDTMQVLACWTLVDFLDNQMDSTYMRDLDALLPKLCALSRATGEELRFVSLRAAGLQALASVVNFMGKFSYVPVDFDEIVAAVLDNYETPLYDEEAENEDGVETHQNWVEEVFKGESQDPLAVARGVIPNVQLPKGSAQFRDASRVESKTPNVWSRICVQNVARLAKEATTVRRVLEPMFQYFDAGQHWPPQKLALAVLLNMQHLMEKSGSEQLSFPLLVRHLDQKNVVDNVSLKSSIVKVISLLVRQSKGKGNVADIGAMTDLVRHLRKSLQASLEASKTSEAGTLTPQKGLQDALEECLTDFAKRVGDAAPLFDMMATSLEKLSVNPIIARTTTEAVCVVAQCVAYLPDQSYTEQVFPEALFQQLLQAMIHPDVETRVNAHHIFALLLVPSSLIPIADDMSSAHIWSESSVPPRSGLAFASTPVLFDTLRRERSGYDEKDSYFEAIKGESQEHVQGREVPETDASRSKEVRFPFASSPRCRYGLKPSKERSWALSLDRSIAQLRRPASRTMDIDLNAVRLSGHQAALLLSTLWLQGMLPDNVPASYEAIANTYILTLAFSQAKTSSHRTVIRAFQLALSLRSLAIDPSYAGIQLPPSRCRSLFTLSAAMLVFSARAYGSPQLGAVAKASLTSSMKDPYLELSDDIRLKIVNSSTSFVNVKDYGSAADDRDAYKSFSGVSISEEQEPEALAALIVGSCPVLGADDFAVADQMLQSFSLEDGFGLSPQFYFETPYSGESPLESTNSLSFDEVFILHTRASVEGKLTSESSGVELPRLLSNVPDPFLTPHVDGVPQLLEAALLASGQVTNLRTLDPPLSYTAMATQCETVFSDSRKKISSVLKLDGEYKSLLLTLPEKYWESTVSMEEDKNQGCLREVLQLPPASPYDMFLKAAGC